MSVAEAGARLDAEIRRWFETRYTADVDIRIDVLTHLAEATNDYLAALEGEAS